jgi:hypothetical protein
MMAHTASAITIPQYYIIYSLPENTVKLKQLQFKSKAFFPRQKMSHASTSKPCTFPKVTD